MNIHEQLQTRSGFRLRSILSLGKRRGLGNHGCLYTQDPVMALCRRVATVGQVQMPAQWPNAMTRMMRTNVT